MWNARTNGAEGRGEKNAFHAGQRGAKGEVLVREYAVKKRPQAARPGPRGGVPGPGVSNQAMLKYLDALPKQRVPEEEGIRRQLSNRFGVDFSGLKITKDAGLGDVELAYTKGNEIHLAPDVSPASPEGQRILAHEAAHVIQQGTMPLSGGVLSDASLEAQAHAMESGGQIDASGFTMPTAAGAPVQGFFGFFRRMSQRRQERNAETAARYMPFIVSSPDEEFTQRMLQSMAKHGFTDTAVYDPAQLEETFKAAANRATGGETGAYRKPEWDENRMSTTYSELAREFNGMPARALDPEKKTRQMYGLSQEELNGMFGLDLNAYRGLLEKSNRAARIAASRDWTKMSDTELLENYPLFKWISRFQVTAAQGTPKVDADKDLARGGHQDLVEELNASSTLID